MNTETEPTLTTLAARVDKLETLNALTARLEKLETLVTTLQNNHNAATVATVETQREDLLFRLNADGKVSLGPDGHAYSAEELKKLDVTTLRMLHANTPSTVPLAARHNKPSETQSGSELTGIARTAAALKQGK